MSKEVYGVLEQRHPNNSLVLAKDDDER